MVLEGYLLQLCSGEHTVPQKGRQTSSYNSGLWGKTPQKGINFGNPEEPRMTVPQEICKDFLQEVMLQ